MGFKVKKSGRFQLPDLDGGFYQAIGTEMVRSMRARIARGRNAYGQMAKPLSKGYAKQKMTYRKIANPIRDMNMTGLAMNNFRLRKANAGVIRADITEAEPRRHALRAQSFEHMFGWAPQDKANVTKLCKLKYGVASKNAWVSAKF